VRKSDLKKNHAPLDAAIVRYRDFMGKIIADKSVVATAQEKRDVAESVVLRLCAHWESFVDEHLVDCANCDPSKLSAYFSVTIPRHPSWDLCHALIIGSGYTDFRDFGDLKGLSKRLLPDASNPFLAVTKLQANRIDEVYRIRNYLSHYSKKARQSLMALYKDEYGMTRFLEPGQFMLGYEAKRLKTYFDAFSGASAAMLAWCSAP
jgi:hypothetical protein